MSAPLLSVKNLTMQFGGLKAVDQLSFEIEQGSLVGMIGPNGAGKTTVFNTLTGVYRPTVGEINFNGTSLVGLKPYAISRMGVTRTFQNIRLFKNLTVMENVLIASIQHVKYTMLDEVLQTARFRKSEQEHYQQAMDILNFFGLADKASEESSSLPYGDQRKLEIVRALATKPKMIFLDEPAAGMNPSETKNLMTLIAKIRQVFGVTILLIEHDMKLVMGVCEKILVLDHGVKIEEGSPQKVQSSKAVIEAYLGVGAEV